MNNKVLVKAEDFTGLTDKVKCSNGDTFLATQMYVNEEEVK